MKKVKDVFLFINKHFPFQNQAKWDNSKVNTKSFINNKLEGILVVLDVNIENIDVAISKNCNVIISHHPIYIEKNDFNLPYLKGIRKKLSNNKITHIPIHTNYDLSKKSMSGKLLNLIANKKAKKIEKNSYGWIAEFNDNFDNLTSKIKKQWNFDYLIFSDKIDRQKKISKIYFCSGSCSSDIEQLLYLNSDIDVYISGEIKWHIWNLAQDKQKILIDIGHNVESFFIFDIINLLKDKNARIFTNSNSFRLTATQK